MESGGEFLARNAELPVTEPLVHIKFGPHPIPAALNLCLLCGSSGVDGHLLRCYDCGECYHAYCLNPPLTVENLIDEVAWRCPHCKFCAVCEFSGNEERLIICDKCDRCFHVDCLAAPPPSLDKDDGWRCALCVLCRRCGTRTSEVWYAGGTECEACAPDVDEEGEAVLNDLAKSLNTTVDALSEIFEFKSKLLTRRAKLRAQRAQRSDPMELEGESNGNINSNVAASTGLNNGENGAILKRGSSQNGVTKVSLEKLCVPASAAQAREAWRYKGGDWRECAFCQLRGDHTRAGRLLPVAELNTTLQPSMAMKAADGSGCVWVHANCALWSPEVIGEADGSIFNVSRALARGARYACGYCHRGGATLGCCVPTCPKLFHFLCAPKAGANRIMDRNGTRLVYCAQHHKAAPFSAHAAELSCDEMLVVHNAYMAPAKSKTAVEELQRDGDGENKTIKSSGRQNGAEQSPSVTSGEKAEVPSVHQFPWRLRVGALTVLELGELVPSHISPYFHTRNVLFPVGFQAVRKYWSLKGDLSAEIYVCKIVLYAPKDALPRPLFRIVALSSKETFLANTADESYATLLRAINKQRAQRSPALPALHKHLRGEFFFGLTWPHVHSCLEQLQGRRECRSYQPRYDAVLRFPRDLWLSALANGEATTPGPLQGAPGGCARATPFQRLTLADKLGALDRYSLNPENAYLSLLSHPKAKYALAQTTYGELAPINSYESELTLSLQYKRMKIANKTGERLRILRSRIQGYGVFSLRKIVAGEMVIEYVGELINPLFADKRESEYNEKGIGCYMFRVPGEDEIIDATMRGNMARFINHSCEPNAKTDWIYIGQKRKIIIFAIVDIAPGDEIVYNYNFSDNGEHVPCHCGAPSCCGWMTL